MLVGASLSTLKNPLGVLGGWLCGVALGALAVGHGVPRATPTALAARDRAVLRTLDRDQARGSRFPVWRGSDGLFRVKALIEGAEVNLIIDTGATTTVLTGADAARVGLGVDRRERADTITTAAGPSAMQWARARQVRVAGVTMTNMDVAIIENGLATSLLGQNMLDRLGPITIDGNTISFGTSG